MKISYPYFLGRMTCIVVCFTTKSCVGATLL